MEEDKVKLKIITEKELNFYYFVIVLGNNNFSVNTIFAYDLDTAIEKIKQLSGNSSWFYSGFFKAKDIIDKIEKFDDKHIESKESITKEQFKCNILYASDEFIKDKKDKKTLKEIINKI